MKDVRQTVRKGALSATTVFIIVSVIFSFLSIGVGSELVLGSFKDLVTTSDRKWFTSNVINNAKPMCGDQDGKIPEEGNFTRKIEGLHKLDHAETGRKKMWFLKNGDDETFISQRFFKSDCSIGVNGSEDSFPVDLNPDKPVAFRLFSGSYSDSGEKLTVEITQP